MATKKRMYYVGTCRICGTGPLGLRSCGKCESVVVLCDECDAVWTDADLSATPSYAAEGDLLCPGCDASLLEAPSHWATKSQIEAIPWLQQAIHQGTFALKRGSAFAPEVEEEG